MKRIIIIIFILLFNSYFLYSAFDLNNFSARPSSMGDAFIAVADDSSASFYNPAGIVQLKKREISSTYSLIYPGLDINNLNQMLFSFIFPVKKKSAIGLGYSGLLMKDLYSENIFQVSFSRKLNNLWYYLVSSQNFMVNSKYLQ